MKIVKSGKFLVVFIIALLMISIVFTGCFGGGDPDADNGDDGEPGSGSGSGGVIEQIDLADTRLFAVSYDEVYDGKEKQPKIEVRDDSNRTITSVFYHQEHDDLIVAFENNINAGTATATVTAKQDSKAFKGTSSVDFTIEQAWGRANGLDAFKEMIDSTNYHTVFTDSPVTIPAGESVTIPEYANVQLRGRDFIVEGTFINNGTITTSNNIGGSCEIFNNGTFTNNGTLDIVKGDTIYNSGLLTNNGELTFAKEATTCIYTNSPIQGEATDGLSSYTVERKDVASAVADLTYTSVRYDGEAKKPSFSGITLNSQTISNDNFSFKYTNNTLPGVATVTATIDNKSTEYYGSITKTFTILKGETSVALADAGFEELLHNENYEKITIQNNVRDIDLTTDFTVREGLVLVINTNKLTINNCITVNGTLIINNISSNIRYDSQNYANTRHKYNPFKFVVNGRLDINATNALISVAQLSGTGVVNNRATMLLSGYSGISSQYSGVTINNYGKMYEGDISSMGSLKIVNKSGAGLYLNDDTVNNLDSDAVTAEQGSIYTVRPAINLADVKTKDSGNAILPFENIELDYNHGTAVYPSIGVRALNSMTELLSADIYHRYTYKHASDQEAPVNVGNVNVTIDFDIMSPYYHGSTVASYAIKPVVLEVTSTVGYGTFDNANYCGYDIKSSLNWSYEIRKDTTITVYPEGQLYVNRFYGEGSLVNNGTIYSTKFSQNIVRGVDTDPLVDNIADRFVNNGTIYANGATLGTQGVGGTIIYKPHITTLTENNGVNGSTFAMSFDDTDNYVSAVCPEVDFRVNGTKLSLLNDYSVSYRDNEKPGLPNAATLQVVCDEDSQLVYGYYDIIEYTVTCGTAKVKNISQLRNVLAVDTYNDSTMGAFDKIYLAGTIVDTTTTSVDLLIRQNVTLDFNSYELALNCATSSTKGYHITNYGKIIVRDNWKEDKMYGIDNKVRASWSRDAKAYTSISGEIIGYVSCPEGVYALSRWCDEIILQSDIVEQWCSRIRELENEAANIIVNSDDCNVFATLLNNGGIAQGNLSEHADTSSISGNNDEYLALQNILDAHIAYENSNGAYNEEYSDLLAKIELAFNTYATIAIAKNASYVVDDSVFVNISTQSIRKNGQDSSMTYDVILTVISRLFGYSDTTLFTNYVSNLCDEYMANNAGTDPAKGYRTKYDGTICLGSSANKYLLLPYVFENKALKVSVITYIMVEQATGNMTMWFNDIAAAFKVANMQHDTYNPTVLADKSMVFVHGRCVLFEPPITANVEIDNYGEQPLTINLNGHTIGNLAVSLRNSVTIYSPLAIVRPTIGKLIFTTRSNNAGLDLKNVEFKVDSNSISDFEFNNDSYDSYDDNCKYNGVTN